jgi:ubiquitin carboxyl-terminal hydrolase L5
MTDKMKGEAIGNSELIRKVHNSFARTDPFTQEDDGVSGVGSADVFHFVSYVPYKGKLYELDGLQDGPICFGDVTEENWIESARTEIQKRIEKYAASEIRFNLLAVCKDRAVLAKETMTELEAKLPMEENADK